MKFDTKSNLLITEGKAAISQGAATVTSTVIDMAAGGSAAFMLTAGTIGASATIDAKLQHSADGSTDWTDEATGAKNDLAITQIVAAGSQSLHVVNPRRRYYRMSITVGTAACVFGVMVAQVKHSVVPA